METIMHTHITDYCSSGIYHGMKRGKQNALINEYIEILRIC